MSRINYQSHVHGLGKGFLLIHEGFPVVGEKL